MSSNRGRIIVLTLYCSFFAVIAAVWAAKSDDIIGLWYNEECDGIIEIYKCADRQILRQNSLGKRTRSSR